MQAKTIYVDGLGPGPAGLGPAGPRQAMMTCTPALRISEH